MLTLHRSKGLEFPVVFLPEAWDCFVPTDERDAVLRLHEDGTEVLDLFSGERHTVGREGRLTLDVGGYGHHWLRLLLPGDRRLR